ncbi:endoribonuclease YbeY isoform X7 [Homo sapiens]|uniref:endoribonuclease YbeY isoform X7 n=1 Tax=Homo sapiens TaxID=9606 RepID=UPI001FB15F7A|nr:endoribonuclease YbeY isoform X7 [Homo sapiens]XP_054180640.1 endoribonuclease YbeY isoform X7 [Homo sapiens]
MSLVIRNLQRVIPIRRAPLRSKIEIVRRILGVQKFDLGIICVDNKNIQHINRIYRDRNVPTDVLSFPFHEVTATHGLCHLLGFTHGTEAEWQQLCEAAWPCPFFLSSQKGRQRPRVGKLLPRATS